MKTLAQDLAEYQYHEDIVTKMHRTRKMYNRICVYQSLRGEKENLRAFKPIRWEEVAAINGGGVN